MTATFPSTGDFPSRPDALAREELDAVYLELRRSYKGLMVSRDQYRSKAERNRAAMQQLQLQQVRQRLWLGRFETPTVPVSGFIDFQPGDSFSQ